MAKTKVSEWSAIPANNTDVGGIDINEGCAPSGINNAIRDMMSQIKDMQTGADGDNFVVGGNLAVTGTSTLDNELIANSSAGIAGQALLSRGAGLSPQWGAAFVTGMIMMWSGSIASIPSGWLLCDGSSSTPDLRNRFVVGAGSTYAVGATGGSADAIVVSHTHTINDSGHTHTSNYETNQSYFAGVFNGANPKQSGTITTPATNSSTTGITINSTGSSGTNANLPPYFALAYIMKA
jgi:microcystin-dependent protein